MQIRNRSPHLQFSESLFWISALLVIGHAEYLSVDRQARLSCENLYKFRYPSCTLQWPSLCLYISAPHNESTYEYCWQISENSLTFPERGAAGEIMDSRNAATRASTCLDSESALNHLFGTDDINSALLLRVFPKPCTGSATQQWVRDETNSIDEACLTVLVDCNTKGLVFQDGYQDVNTLLRPDSVRFMAWMSLAACLVFFALVFSAGLCWAYTNNIPFRVPVSISRIMILLSKLLSLKALPASEKELWEDHKTQQAQRLFLVYLLFLPMLLIFELMAWLRVRNVFDFLTGGFELDSHEYAKITQYVVNRNILPSLAAGFLCALGWKFTQRRSRCLIVVQVCLAARFIAIACLRASLPEFYDMAFEAIPLRMAESIALGNLPVVLTSQACVTLFEVLVGVAGVVPGKANIHNFVIRQVSLYLAIVLITAICEYMRLAYIELYAKSLCSEAAVSRLLDHTSDGYCKVSLNGTVVTASLQMQATLKHKLLGAKLEDFMYHQDSAAFQNFLQSWSEGTPHMDAFLVTFQVAGDGDRAVLELFDARLVLYTAAQQGLSMCITVIGERRFCSMKKVDSEGVGLRDLYLPADKPNDDTEPLRQSSAAPSMFEAAVCMPRADIQDFAWQAPSKANDPIVAQGEKSGRPASSPEILCTGPCSRGPRLCSGGDCLPETAEVQALGPDGQPVRRLVKDLQAGDYVHCLDHLQQGPRYARIISVGVTSGMCKWTQVQFSDGAKVEMTSDHPVRTSGPLGVPKKAGQLEAMTDQMWVTKTESALVKDVNTWEEAKPRVSVVFAQAARFSMFVSSRGSEFSSIAVESANFEGSRSYLNNTFAVFWEGSETQGSDKPASAPAALVPAEGSEADTLSQELELKGVSVILRGGSEADSISLSDVMHTMRSNVPSLGSWAHSNRNCEPCRFQHFHQQDPQSNPACTKGKLCGFCHAPHSEEYRKVTRNATARNRRKNKEFISL